MLELKHLLIIGKRTLFDTDQKEKVRHLNWDEVSN